MHDEGVVLNMQKRMVYFDKEESNKPRMFLRSTRDCQVAELSERLIPCQVITTLAESQLEDPQVRGDFLVETCSLPSLAKVDAALVRVNRGRSKLVMSNPTGVPAFVPKGTLFAIEACTSEQICEKT